MVKVWRQHKQWITNVHMQRGGLRELVSGSRNGEVKLWDIRSDAPLREVVATGNTLRTLSVHEHAPVFATWVFPPFPFLYPFSLLALHPPRPFHFSNTSTSPPPPPFPRPNPTQPPLVPANTPPPNPAAQTTTPSPSSTPTAPSSTPSSLTPHSSPPPAPPPSPAPLSTRIA